MRAHTFGDGTDGTATSALGADRGAARRKLLVIDDDVRVAEALGRVLGLDHEVTIAVSGKEGLSLLLAGRPFDFVICDLMMAEMSGMDFYDEVVRTLPDVVGRLVFMTGGAYTRRARAFVEHVRSPCFDKPLDLRRLRAWMDNR